MAGNIERVILFLTGEVRLNQKVSRGNICEAHADVEEMCRGSGSKLAYPSPFRSNTQTTSPSSSSSVHVSNSLIERSVGEEEDVDAEEVSRRNAQEDGCGAHCPDRTARKHRLVRRPKRTNAGLTVGRPVLNIFRAYAARRKVVHYTRPAVKSGFRWINRGIRCLCSGEHNEWGVG
eukprot:5645851-Pyramimonas_sp.AAC.1